MTKCTEVECAVTSWEGIFILKDIPGRILDTFVQWDKYRELHCSIYKKETWKPYKYPSANKMINYDRFIKQDLIYIAVKVTVLECICNSQTRFLKQNSVGFIVLHFVSKYYFGIVSKYL